MVSLPSESPASLHSSSSTQPPLLDVADDRLGKAAVSFVPRLLAERLVRGPLVAPERLTVDGAFLLSDIVAFTAHLERCAQAGQLDDVITTFDAYFAAITRAVQAHGGDILTTAGDGFLAYWPNSATGPRVALEAACSAAHAIVAAPSGGLQSRIGISTGTAFVDLVGGVHGRWELLPGGPAVADAVACEAVASPGLPCLSAPACAVLGDDKLAARRDGRGELASSTPAHDVALDPGASPPDVPFERLAPFVPAPILRWGAEAADWLAEFRNVTTVVASLRSLPEDESLQRRHGIVVAFQEIAQRYDAAAKVYFDGKGASCSAVFGLPPRAHDDDVDRALRAGVDLGAALKAHDLPGGVGISHGRVCCGVFGSEGRREYTLFGDAVNVAARLASLAGEEILVDHGTTSATSLVLEVERRPTAAVKNRRSPLRVHRLVSLRQTPRPPVRMVGRNAERERLQAAVDALARGETPPPILIRGEPGIGKSTLIEAVRAAATDAGLRVATVTGEPLERGTSYGALRPLLSPLFADTGLDALAERTGLGVEQKDLLPLLNPFLDRPLQGTLRTEALSAEARRERLHQMLVEALRRAALLRPTLLVVEDLQWIDSLSRMLLEQIASGVPHLLSVLTARSGEIPDATPALGITIDLGPLEADDVADLVRDRLRIGTVDPAILRLVAERAGGHPFFSEALIESMIQAGAIRISGEGAELLDAAGLAVPVTVDAAVLSRLDALAASEQLTLKAAAIVGRACTVEEVAAAHPFADADNVAVELDSLADRDLLRTEPSGAYAFRHQIIQEVARGLLPGTQVRQMHGALAAYYEQRRAEPPPPEHLAHHWLQADAPETAAPYLEAAGRQALHHGAFADALVLLQRAIHATPHAGDRRRAEQELGLAEAHYYLGDFLHSRTLLEQALERLGYGSEGTSLATVREVGRSLAFSLSRNASRRPRRTPDDAELLRTASNAMRRLVQIGYLHGSSPLETTRLAVRGLELAERSGPSPELARALANGAVLASLCGLRGVATRYAARATTMAELPEHASAAAYVWNVVAILRVGEGRWAEALSASDQALSRFAVVGDANLEAELWQTRSAIEIGRGALDPATTAWARTAEIAERTGSAMNRCLSLLDQAQTHIARDKPDAGRAAIDAAQAIELVEADAGTLIERRATTALMCLDEGRYLDAAREADAVLSVLARRLPLEWVWIEFGVHALDVLLDLRILPDADIPTSGLERRIDRGLGAVSRGTFSFPAQRGRLEVIRGSLALVHGDELGARRHLARARRLTGAPDQALDAARADVLAARLAVDAKARDELIARADAVFAGLGQERERRRAQVLLET